MSSFDIDGLSTLVLPESVKVMRAEDVPTADLPGLSPRISPKPPSVKGSTIPLIPGMDIPDLVSRRHTGFVWDPRSEEWHSEKSDDPVHRVGVEDRRQSGMSVSELICSTIVFSDDSEDDIDLNYEALLKWLKKIGPHAVCLVNVPLAFVAMFVSQQWVRRRYHVSDTDDSLTGGVLMSSSLEMERSLSDASSIPGPATCNVEKYRLLIASALPVERFAHCRLYDSTGRLSTTVSVDDLTLEKNEDMHHALRHSTSSSPQTGPLPSPLITDGRSSPHASKYQKRQDALLDARLADERIAASAFRDSPERREVLGPTKSDSPASGGTRTPERRVRRLSLCSLSATDCYLLRAQLNLGHDFITVSCLRYAPRFLDRKKQFAQCYHLISYKDSDGVLCGKSCEMCYKHPEDFIHAWKLRDESEADIASDIPDFLPEISHPAMGYLRPSFLSLADDFRYEDVRTSGDKGSFVLVKSPSWVVESVEHFELPSLSCTEDMDVVDDEELSDAFGDGMFCHAQCVFLSRVVHSD